MSPELWIRIGTDPAPNGHGNVTWELSAVCLL